MIERVLHVITRPSGIGRFVPCTSARQARPRAPQGTQLTTRPARLARLLRYPSSAIRNTHEVIRSTGNTELLHFRQRRTLIRPQLLTCTGTENFVMFWYMWTERHMQTDRQTYRHTYKKNSSHLYLGRNNNLKITRRPTYFSVIRGNTFSLARLRVRSIRTIFYLPKFQVRRSKHRNLRQLIVAWWIAILYSLLVFLIWSLSRHLPSVCSMFLWPLE